MRSGCASLAESDPIRHLDLAPQHQGEPLPAFPLAAAIE
jgi:hypothetical protein